MFFLLGPTAVGKSEIAAEVALRTGAEIVGADAFQIYKGLELLTAAPDAETRAKVPHHLVGEIAIGQVFDAAQYRELALAKVREIERRGRRALVVGGTGLYARALMHGLSDMPGSDEAVREALAGMTLVQLQEKYAALDPVGMERIDRQNRRRLVRAIEVTLLAGKPFSALRRDWSGRGSTAATAAGVVLDRDRDDLYARIDARVTRMFEQGVIEEVARAGEAGATAAQAIGYGEIRALIAGTVTLEECMSAIARRTRRYAKRQLTWLRRENTLYSINLTHQSHSVVINAIEERMAEAGRI
jgi:tRNA dimethylallyltransferase